MTMRATQITAFLIASGWADASRKLVAGDASSRRYDRLHRTNGDTAILMDAAPDTGEDVRPFIQIANHLRQAGLSAPQIIASDTSAGLLIIEDFGDALFADLMAADPAQEIPLYQAATDVLIQLQQTTPPNLPACDATWLSEMISPLFEWYIPKANPDAIGTFYTLFQPLAQRVAAAQPVMILRDYHAQNLLLLDERVAQKRVGILDFQDALLGHRAYDLVSILQDARRDVSAAIESEIIDYMLDQTNLEDRAFRTAYAILGLQRNLRILGIFARLSQRDAKPHYVDFIPRVWGYIERNLMHPDLCEIASHLKSFMPPPTPTFLEQLRTR